MRINYFVINAHAVIILGYLERMKYLKSVLNATVPIGTNPTKVSIMKNQAESRIIKAMKKKDGYFPTLRHLAIEAGFSRVNEKQFKEAFNKLTKNGIVKLHPSGWGLHTPDIEKLPEYSESAKENKDIQEYWKRYPCIDCHVLDLKASGNLVDCPKYGWEMSIELAKKQELCAY